MLIHDLNFELYISAPTMQQKIEELAKRIEADFTDCTERPLFMITLGGAVVFAVDLCRHFNFVTEWSYVKCSSYNEGLTSSRNVKFELEPTISPQGRDVIVLEDIVDTGNTYQALHSYLMQHGAKSVRIASMIIKRDVYDKDLPIDYVALESDDIFLIGMGLDYNQLGRNLNGIYKLAK